MPLQATSGAASYDAFGGGAAAVPQYIEDVFSTWLYDGNSSTQTITNGIDLSGKGGAVWIKQRNGTGSHEIRDTVRGSNKAIYPNSTIAEGTSTVLSAFTSSGFSLNGLSYNINESGANYASWTFRKQPKFFDVVTYTGTGTTNSVAHSLASVPGAIFIKRTSSSADWRCLCKNGTDYSPLKLNTTDGDGGTPIAINLCATSTTLDIGYIGLVTGNTSVNTNGETYVAYIFAHNAGGFGLTGTDNVISCGSYVGNGSTNGPTVTLGYEPQWILVKNASGANPWNMDDNMRGWEAGGLVQNLQANASYAESQQGPALALNSTGFKVVSSDSDWNGTSATYVYIAIRRGPMKVPTSGTSVFSPQTFVDGTTTFTPNFPLDLNWHLFNRGVGGGIYWGNRLTGDTAYMNSSSTNAEGSYQSWKYGLTTGTFQQTISTGSGDGIEWMFRRAPSFFDEVCYTGTGSALTVNHNLGVAPEIIIIKKRVAIGSSTSWYCGWNMNASTYMEAILNTSDAGTLYNYPNWFTSAPTSTTFALAGGGNVNSSGATAVAYLFATCAGVSKVGSYTGTGTTKQIDCGFTGGARFVLIKRTDSTGDWYVWDSARGIVSGNDPYLLLNSTAAEVTSTDYIDTYSAGFEISSTAPAAINASGGTYIFLAIA